MKKSDLYEIAIKLAGIYLFMTMIISALMGSATSIMFFGIRLLRLSHYQEQYEQINSTPYIIIFFVIYFLLLILSLLLIFRTRSVSKLICSKTDFEQDVNLLIDTKIIYEVALILFGLASLTWVLPEFGYRLGEQLQTVTPKSSHFPLVSVIRIILSVIVIIKSKSLAKYFSRKSNEDKPLKEIETL